MRQRLTLIDLDTISFLVAFNQSEKLGNKEDAEAVRINIREFLSIIQVNTRADVTSMVYQDINHFNFRKYFYPTYKSNRPETPEFMRIWKDTIIDEYRSLGAVGVKVIESDDVLNIGYNRFKEEYELIIVSADKDLLQVPGEHYHPKYNTSFYVTKHDAMYNLFYQIVSGDDSDGIKGIYGFAAKPERVNPLLKAPKVEKLLNGCYTAYTITNKIHEIYRNTYGEIWYSEYLKTKFLVTLLKDVDYNLYPFCEEVSNLFNIIPVSSFVVTNLFN